MTSAFDNTAASFERCRPLPGGAPEAIRSAIWAAAGISTPARVLDVGAGTGRFGRSFVAAGDFYVGVDNSLAMLREFVANCAGVPVAQADGRQLPFHDGAFDAVLLIQVLGGAGDWRAMLGEARRVLRSGGIVAVGHTVHPETGIDAQLKRRLNSILEEMRVVWHRPQEGRRQALAWLESSATRHVHSRAVSWNVTASAREFLLRHPTGARFAALPLAVREPAMEKLRVWSEQTFGSVGAEFQEERSFDLDVFEFGKDQK